jgi:hypothetical protein
MGRKHHKGKRDEETGEAIPSELKAQIAKDPELKPKEFVEFYRVS